jgi:hypothetical protein
VLGKAEQSQDVSFFIELTIESGFFRILKYQYVGNSSSLIVGRIAMRPYEERRIWVHLVQVEMNKTW